MQKFNSKYNVNYKVENIEGIHTSISKSETTESVYVYYRNPENDNSVTVRFSHHENNGVKFGDQLDGYSATLNEIKYRLGLINRRFIPEKRKTINCYRVKKVVAAEMIEAPYTIQELYAMPIGTDLSEFKGMVAKGSNWVIDGGIIVEENITRLDCFGNEVTIGYFEYFEK